MHGTADPRHHHRARAREPLLLPSSPSRLTSHLSPHLSPRTPHASTRPQTLTSLQLPLTGAIKSVFTGGTDRQLSDVEKIGAPAIGGALSGFACAPMELSMIQQQRFGSSLVATPGIIVGELGITGACMA